MIKISLTNSKLGTMIPSINLPAIITCRKDAPCAASGCYAKKGNFVYRNVQKSLMNNLEEYKKDPVLYFEQIKMFLLSNPLYKFFRFHSSGDIVDHNYLQGMLKVAQEVPQVKFLCFTKQFEIVNEMYEYALNNKWCNDVQFPPNLKIVFSAWDKDFEVINPYNFPVAYVAFKDHTKNPNIPELAIPCIGKCAQCQACWSLRKGQSTVFKQH